MIGKSGTMERSQLNFLKQSHDDVRVRQIMRKKSTARGISSSVTRSGTASQRHQNSIKRYKVSPDILGQGTYGVVYKALDLLTEKKVALKELKLLEDEEEGIPATVVREVSILRRLDHQNVVWY